MDWSLIAKIWNQIADILNSLASPILAGFTIVLAIATVKLHRSTKRYADATDNLVQTTELACELEIIRARIDIGISGLSSLDARKNTVEYYTNKIKILRQKYPDILNSDDLYSDDL